jgi:hypothetical protein
MDCVKFRGKNTSLISKMYINIGYYVVVNGLFVFCSFCTIFFKSFTDCVKVKGKPYER